MKKAVALIIIAVIFISTTISAGALDYGCDVDTTTSAVYVENLDTDTVVLDKASEQKMYPASTTKIMTYIVVAENVSDFENTMVKIDEDVLADMDPESSVMGLLDHIGEEFSVLDLLYGLMLPSGNDAALVLARYVGESIDGFADMMNKKAETLGCKNTHFVNPNGLFDENHYTTARDMAVITKYAMTLDRFKEITNTKSYMPKGFSEPIETTNYMIDSSQEGGKYYYEYAKGIKTGYTAEAGKCLVSTAQRDGYTYLCVALGADYSEVEQINYAMLDSAEIYDWAFNNLSYQTLYSKDEAIKSVAVDYTLGNKTTDIVAQSDIKTLLNNSYDKLLLTYNIECEDKVAAPIKKGDVLGKLTIYYDNEEVGSANLVASEDIKRSFLVYAAHKTGEFISSHLWLVILLLIIIVLIIVLLLLNKRQKRIQREKRQNRVHRSHRYR